MNGYHTELDYDSGLTYIVCDECGRGYLAGTKPIHNANCSRVNEQRPKRREVSIRRIISYQVYGQLDENGAVIIP